MVSITITNAQGGVNEATVTYEIFSQFTEPEIEGTVEITGPTISPQGVDFEELISVPYDETGGTAMGTVDFQFDLLPGTDPREFLVTARITSPDSSQDTSEITVSPPESSDGGDGETGEPNFVVRDIQIQNEPLQAGEQAEVLIRVENTGSVNGNAVIDVDVDGTFVGQFTKSIPSNEIRNETITFLSDNPGTFTVQVGGVTEDVTFQEPQQPGDDNGDQQPPDDGDGTNGDNGDNGFNGGNGDGDGGGGQNGSFVTRRPLLTLGAGAIAGIGVAVALERSSEN